MTELTYPTPTVGEKETTAEPRVDTALSEIKTVVNGQLGGANVESVLTGYRLIDSGRTALLELNAGTYYFTIGGSRASSEFEASVNPIATIYTPSDFEVTPKVTKLSLKADLFTNATASTSNFAVQLLPITALGGAAKKLALTLGGAVAEVTFNTPAHETAVTGKTTIAAPAAGLGHLLAVTITGNMAASSFVAIHAQVFASNT